MLKEKLRLTKKGTIADDEYKGPIINVTLYPVGSQPTKVAAEWQVEGTALSGIAFGGFQRREDFDYPTARKLAIDNAISMARL
jgi:hypothetical protein